MRANLSQAKITEILGRKITSYRRIGLGEIDISLYEARLFSEVCRISLYALAAGEKLPENHQIDVKKMIINEVDMIDDPELLQSILESVRTT